MPRCESCSKFCSVDHAADIEDVQAAQGSSPGEVEVTGSVYLTLSSECCYDELGAESLEFEEVVAIEHASGCPALKEDEDVEYEVEAEAEPDDRYETTDRKGKPIRNPRYQKHYYGAAVTITVVCQGCEASGEGEAHPEEQASALFSC